MEHTPQPRPHHREQHHNHLRPQQRAPRGVDIKDRRPLRGRPFGPILDPDASPGAAQQQAKETVRKIHNKNNGLTGPAPSGMTASQARTVLRPAETENPPVTAVRIRPVGRR